MYWQEGEGTWFVFMFWSPSVSAGPGWQQAQHEASLDTIHRSVPQTPPMEARMSNPHLTVTIADSPGLLPTPTASHTFILVPDGAVGAGGELDIERAESLAVAGAS